MKRTSHFVIAALLGQITLGDAHKLKTNKRYKNTPAPGF